ncbi:hypothetical protein ACFE04_031201 [Oxalis oulophora]
MVITRSMKRKNVETQPLTNTRIIQNKSNKKLKNLKVDRLSNLSDDLILHILRFLGAHLAVQTCVLAKRWRHLWEYQPALNMKIIVSAPELTSFKFHDVHVDFTLSIENSPRLYSVDFHIAYLGGMMRPRKRKSQRWKEPYLSKLSIFFKATRNAKSLSMSMQTMKVLSALSKLLKDQDSPFDNLENLILTQVEKGYKVPLIVKRYLLGESST